MAGGKMVSFRQLVDNGFVEIKFSGELKEIHGAKFVYSLDGKIWNPCSIFPGIDSEIMLLLTFWEWNQAAQSGNIKFMKKPHPLYWNLYLNNLHQFCGKIKVRCEILTASEVVKFEDTIGIVKTNAQYFSNWRQQDLPDGWEIVNGCIAPVAGKDAGPFVLKPFLKGSYRIYIGILYGIVNMRICLGEEKIRYPFIAERTRPEFQDKCYKEIFWKSVELKETSTVEISPTPLSIREPEKWPSGAIYYIKMVPEKKGERNEIVKGNPCWSDKILALYFEPYSWAFCYNLNSKSEVEEVMKIYKEMGADQIHNQVIRFGSKALYHSKIAEPFTKGAMMGDDGTFSPGPSSMVRSLDILKETIDVCRKSGMVHYANAALTNCYPGTDFEERISREHPEWRTGNILRYNREETRKYVASIIKEFIEWGTDGISIDCMRYPNYHTYEDLLALFQEIHNVMREFPGNKKIPLTVRIPAGDTIYYNAFKSLAKDGIIQCIVPSNLLAREPMFSLKPYIKFKDFGCQVFGIIDGWLTHMASYFRFQLSLHRYPSDIVSDIKRFFKEGADGIYVYQADLYCADPFTREVFNWRKWRRR